jgi:impB/mucB/samB family
VWAYSHASAFSEEGEKQLQSPAIRQGWEGVQVYRILMQYTTAVQPLSCDEAFLDVTGLGDPELLASRMRAEIEAATSCTASAGIGPNLLLARLATKHGKPNGQFRILSSQVLLIHPKLSAFTPLRCFLFI